MENKKIILAFHIGRGGRFNNPGHLTYLGEQAITELSVYNDLFQRYEHEYKILKRFEGHENIHQALQDACTDSLSLRTGFTAKHIAQLARVGLTPGDFGQIIYVDHNGEGVGLTSAEAETGIGCIDIDAQYDTTYTVAGDGLGEEEMNAILAAYKSSQYISIDVINILKDADLMPAE